MGAAKSATEAELGYFTTDLNQVSRPSCRATGTCCEGDRDGRRRPRRRARHGARRTSPTPATCRRACRAARSRSWPCSCRAPGATSRSRSGSPRRRSPIIPCTRSGSRYFTLPVNVGMVAADEARLRRARGRGGGVPGAGAASSAEIFATSSRLERGFWEMAYTMDQWPDLAGWPEAAAGEPPVSRAAASALTTRSPLLGFDESDANIRYLRSQRPEGSVGCSRGVRRRGAGPPTPRPTTASASPSRRPQEVRRGRRPRRRSTSRSSGTPGSAIVGPSGGGKSTLLHIVAGLIEPDGGAVNVEGATDRQGAPGPVRDDAAARPAAAVADRARQRDHRAGEPGRLPVRGARTKTRPLFERFGLAEFEDVRPAQLSGGMRQRVSFLRTLDGREGRAAARRAVRRARLDHPGADAGVAAAAPSAMSRGPCCSSPTTWRRRCC